MRRALSIRCGLSAGGETMHERQRKTEGIALDCRRADGQKATENPCSVGAREAVRWRLWSTLWITGRWAEARGKPALEQRSGEANVFGGKTLSWFFLVALPSRASKPPRHLGNAACRGDATLHHRGCRNGIRQAHLAQQVRAAEFAAM